MAPFHCKDTSPTLARSGTLAARALIRSGPEGAQGVFDTKVGFPSFCIYIYYLFNVGTFRRNLVEL